MADQAYNSSYKATQDALKPLRGQIAKLSAAVGSIAHQVQLIDDVFQATKGLQGELKRHDPRAEYSMGQIRHDLQELKARLEPVERFCREMSAYYHRAPEDSEPEEGFRSP